MEYKSLFWGVLMAIGIFAVKSGAGSHYYLSQTPGRRRRASMLAAMWLVYLLMFAALSLVIQKTNLASFFGLVQGVVQWAMAIHFIMAGGLVVWGVMLLRGRRAHQHKSMGWLALAVPCPVCLVVIFFTLAFLSAYFPDHPHQVMFLALAGFTGVQIITILFLWIWRSKSNASPESTLGGVMLIIAVYFLLSVFIMPGFSELERIYRLALPPVDNQPPAAGTHYWIIAGSAGLFAAGFIRKWKGDHFSCK